MTQQEYLEFHKAQCERMVSITAAKNADYTGGSSDPFANFRQISGLVNIPSVVEVGFLTRMSDKMSRIGSYVTNGTLRVKDESVADTLLDLANYCILFSGYLKSLKLEPLSQQEVDHVLSAQDRDKPIPERSYPTDAMGPGVYLGTIGSGQKFFKGKGQK